LLATAAAAKTVSASAAPSLESSLNKKIVGVYLWKTSSIALSLNSSTFGTEYVLTKAERVSAVIVGNKSFLNSSKVLKMTTCPSTALLAAPTSAEAAPNDKSSFCPANVEKAV